MNQEQNITETTDTQTNRTNMTSPISANNLVSKINSLTNNNRTNSMSSPQSKSFGAEKYITLEYKTVMDSIMQLMPIDNLNEFYSKVYGIILQNIDSGFFAVGLYKEKSNCIKNRTSRTILIYNLQ